MLIFPILKSFKYAKFQAIYTFVLINKTAKFFLHFENPVNHKSCVIYGILFRTEDITQLGVHYYHLHVLSRSGSHITASTIFSLQLDPLPKASTIVENNIMMTFNLVNNHTICMYRLIIIILCTA